MGERIDKPTPGGNLPFIQFGDSGDNAFFAFRFREFFHRLLELGGASLKLICRYVFDSPARSQLLS